MLTLNSPKIKTIKGVQKNRLIITNIQPLSVNNNNDNLSKHSQVKHQEEDPFLNAVKENDKLNKINHEKSKKYELFQINLKKRLKEYKAINMQLEQDCQLKINKSNEFKRSLSVNSLPNCLLRTLKDDQKLNEKTELKKRIISTRKIYSNNERDQVQKLKQQVETTNLKDKAKKKDALKNKQQQQLVIKHKEEPIINIPIIQKQDELIIINNINAKNNNNNNIERYIKCLKQLLKDKAKHYKLDMPPLCQCNLFGSDSNQTVNVWDNDWNNCANNCLFYKNPKGFYLFYEYLFNPVFHFN